MDRTYESIDEAFTEETKIAIKDNAAKIRELIGNHKKNGQYSDQDLEAINNIVDSLKIAGADKADIDTTQIRDQLTKKEVGGLLGRKGGKQDKRKTVITAIFADIISALQPGEEKESQIDKLEGEAVSARSITAAQDFIAVAIQKTAPEPPPRRTMRREAFVEAKNNPPPLPARNTTPPGSSAKEDGGLYMNPAVLAATVFEEDAAMSGGRSAAKKPTAEQRHIARMQAAREGGTRAQVSSKQKARQKEANAAVEWRAGMGVAIAKLRAQKSKKRAPTGIMGPAQQEGKSASRRLAGIADDEQQTTV